MNGFDNFPMFFKSSEFFPMGVHQFSAIGDLPSYLLYLLLGYRLGPLASLFEIFISVFIGFKVIQIIIRDKQIENKLLYLILMFISPFIFIINESMFEIATYFSDNFYLMISMCILYLIVAAEKFQSNKSFLFTALFGLLSGILITKLTNVIYFLPFFGIYATLLIGFYNRASNNKLFYTLKHFLIFTFLIFLINYNFIFFYLDTKNPLFPYFNGVFKSIYYKNLNLKFDPRYGPDNFFQQIFYPFYVFDNPKVLGDVKDIFPDTKLIIIFTYNLISLIFLNFYKVTFRNFEKKLILIYFTSYFLWQFLFGYSRYGMFLEILGGLVSLVLILRLWEMSKSLILRLFSIFYVIYIVVQGLSIIHHNLKYDYSWRPIYSLSELSENIFSIPIFAKYTYVPENIKNELKDVELIIQCAEPTAGYAATIEPLKNLPILNMEHASSNIDLVINKSYSHEQNKRITNLIHNSPIKSVAISNYKGGPDSGISRKRCMESIEQDKRFIFQSEYIVGNFLGDGSQQLSIIIGSFNPKNIKDTK